MASIEDLKYLSERRLEASEVLNENKISDIAFHDAGYIVEFALKATICKKIEVDIYPDNKREYRTHHFDSLVALANLSEELAEKKAYDRNFMKNWSIATRWSVHLRYDPIGDSVENKAKALLTAIKSEEGGVLPWIRSHW